MMGKKSILRILVMKTDLFAVLERVGTLHFSTADVVDKELLWVAPASGALGVASVLRRLEVCGSLFRARLHARHDFLVSLQER